MDFRQKPAATTRSFGAPVASWASSTLRRLAQDALRFTPELQCCLTDVNCPRLTRHQITLPEVIHNRRGTTLAEFDYFVYDSFYG